MFDILKYQIISYRGLWDRFALPNTVDAFKRAYVKNVPFILDLTANNINVAELEKEGIFNRLALPIIIKSKSADIFHEITREIVRTQNLYFVQTPLNEIKFCNIYWFNDEKHLKICGLYFLIEGLYDKKSVDFRQHNAGEEISFILYESVDVIQSIEDMKLYADIRDSETLTYLKDEFGNSMQCIKASDLVEREFLIRQVEGSHAA